ncbi:MAG: hypothetical protein Q7U04_08040 [Bacteriovorax sp.]|nr:hypothetical protein [Bacteriovorax sp.]
MKSIFTKFQLLRSQASLNRLNFGHTYLLIITFLFLTIACGKVVNSNKRSDIYSGNTSLLTMEHDCVNNTPVLESKISKSIEELYRSSIQNLPQLFFSINSRTYNYDTPMVLSIDKMTTSYRSLKDNVNLNQNAEELFYLYNGSRRFEDQKCSFSTITQNKKNDIRPFLNIAHFCYKKYQSETCADSEFIYMSAELTSFVKENTVELCKSFSREVSCQAEFNINKRKKTLGSMVNLYYGRFEKERYGALFSLKPTHQKYKCQKSNENKTIMTIKVLETSLSKEGQLDLLSHAEEIWSNKNFSLKLELVKQYSEGTITIVPISKGISYVPDSNNRMVYLSTQNDPDTTKRIFAHEFGHVLGFPDCYIEFYDDFKKELVYYEISKNNTNIMCSLKNGVKVQDDYFSQLEQNSCIFN